MNAQQIRENITIEEVLNYFGHKPVIIKPGKLEYLSPFREETKASFFVDEKRNIFKDFGNGYGGSPIDLVMKLKNISFTETIKFFNEDFAIHTPININNQKKINQEKENKNINNISITDILDIKNYYLKEYLIGRNVSLSIAKKYLKEIHFKLNDKELYSLGFKNNSEGYELRNNFYKGNINGKDITYFQNNKENKKLIMFEGFMDFLSYITINGENSNENFIILNTSSFIIPFKNINEIKPGSISENILNIVRKHNKIETYFDNDGTGKKITDLMKKVHINVEDKSNLYELYKDLNKFLMNSSKTKKLNI